MFHIVDFKGGRKKTVVPDTWLSINDTICLLPSKVSDQDLEVLARNRIEPGEGWQIFNISSLETFESYSEAKAQLEKSKGTPQQQAKAQLEKSKGTPQPQVNLSRKRKQPGYLADYAVRDSGEGQESYTVFSSVDDEEDMSANDWDTPSAPQFVPRMNKALSSQRMIVNHGNTYKGRPVAFNQYRPSFRKEIVDVKCACKSSCHGTILQALQSMQKQLDKTNQMVQQLLTERPKSTPLQPKRSHFRQPYNHMDGQEEMEDDSQDTNFIKTVYPNQDTSAADERTVSLISLNAADDISITRERLEVDEDDVLKNINIRNWLMSCPKGRELKLKLESEIFFPKDRQLLVRLVCKKLIQLCGNAYPTTLMKEKVAKEIVKQFPFLKSSRGAGHEAFYDKKTGTGFIAYRLDTIRKNLPHEEKKNCTINNPASQKLPNGAEIAVKEELLSPSDLEENVAWMAEQDPNEENKPIITEKLKETLKNRQKEIKETDMSVAEIFNRYPRLKDYNGEMISMEFSQLYTIGEKFLEKFESYFAPRILTYVSLHKPLLLLQLSHCEDNLKSLILLPELLPSPNYKRANQTPRGSKNAQTLQNGRKMPNPDLIVFVNSEEKFQEVTTDTVSQSLQPYLICKKLAHGNGGKKYFIRVDETVIEGPDDPLLAFDIMFKLHYVFNVQYAKNLENFYNFVSSIIYEIDKPRSSSDAFYTLLRNIPVAVDE